MVKIGINGFGRIGRGVFRAGFSNPDFKIVAINNDHTDHNELAHLLKYDSVHGRFQLPVTIEKDNFVVDNHKIRIFTHRDPQDIPWQDCDVDVVLECTGVFRKKIHASSHLRGSVKKVIISSPSPDPDLTLVYGINEKSYNFKKHHIISNASCTTNCVAPLIKVLHENFRIKRASMTTVHSYTNDQRILDLHHKDLRRARAAALSMIPTSTGATDALVEIYPELKNKMSGLSIRVPTPCVSLVDLVAEVEKKVSVSEVNDLFEKNSHGDLKGILGVSNEPLVSADFLGDPRSSILDAALTQVVDGHQVKLISWYDNEVGFSNRMVDLALFVMKHS